MQKEQIIEQLKEFYPAGVSLDDTETYVGSEAFNNRKLCIESAWSDRRQWEQLKDSLSDLSAEIWDYSFMGGSPSYHFSFSQQQNDNTLYSLFVSVILPYYAIRIMDLSNLDKSFNSVSDADFYVSEKLGNKVKIVFPLHRIIKDEALLQAKIDIFEADGENPLSIQHLLFSTIET
ncbi:hypothetical protein [Sphingobacterium sp. BIGb0165]|uniref:hypothetical protein n=1 Tax=Sphingobacterium sp. BIGb0165 TaxID=2940615 RepID=UPI00216A616D|nr:hypothetical protein [Sphingobacterium sp. BIGb0165]MCS4229255.1 hypothetical protein [Sphingobacterium sp. BIGb0165]